MNSASPFTECHGRQRVGAEGVAPLSSRLPAWVNAPADAETVLSKQRVAIIGTGSVGLSVADHVARLRVGEIWLVDPRACCKPESLLTHPIHHVSGQPKAALAARRCKNIAPASKVLFFQGRVQDLPLDAMAHTTVWFMATDNLTAEVEVGQRCLRLGKPLIHAALHGETMTSQVRVFGNQNADSPCPACQFGAEEWRLVSSEKQYSCEGGASGGGAPDVSGPPTRSAGCHCSLTAGLAVHQFLRLVLKLGASVENTILEYCAYTHRTQTSQLRRNILCRCDHSRFKVVAGVRPLQEYSFNTLATDHGFEANDPVLSLIVGGATWVERVACRCTEPCWNGHFVNADERKRLCAKCRAEAELLPFHTHRAVTAQLLGKSRAKPFVALGVSRVPWVLLRDSKQTVLVEDPARLPMASSEKGDGRSRATGG